MLVVTGANGKLGRLVVEALLARIPADGLALSVRDPERASDLASRGVRVRRGDFAEPATLAAAFEGAVRILLVSSNSAGENAVRDHRAAIAAAKAAGAKRIFYTSHVGASATSPFSPMPHHAATELALADAGVPATVLRNGFYADSAMMLLGDALASGELVAPADGPVSWTAHADLGLATALLLADDTLAGSTTLALTAAETIDFAGIAALLSEASDRAVRRVVVADEAYRAVLVARGVPAPRADMLVGMFRASRNGEFSRVDPLLGTLLRRPPTPLRDVIGAVVRASRDRA